MDIRDRIDAFFRRQRDKRNKHRARYRRGNSIAASPQQYSRQQRRQLNKLHRKLSIAQATERRADRLMDRANRMSAKQSDTHYALRTMKRGRQLKSKSLTKQINLGEQIIQIDPRHEHYVAQARSRRNRYEAPITVRV